MAIEFLIQQIYLFIFFLRHFISFVIVSGVILHFKSQWHPCNNRRSSVAGLFIIHRLMPLYYFLCLLSFLIFWDFSVDIHGPTAAQQLRVVHNFIVLGGGSYRPPTFLFSPILFFLLLIILYLRVLLFAVCVLI